MKWVKIGKEYRLDGTKYVIAKTIWDNDYAVRQDGATVCICSRLWGAKQLVINRVLGCPTCSHFSDGSYDQDYDYCCFSQGTPIHKITECRAKIDTCPLCHGHGRLYEAMTTDQLVAMAPDIPSSKCRRCNGMGVVMRDDKMEVTHD